MLVDREAELATLSAALAESARGIGGFAVIHGATALGKTELLHALRTRATEHGFTVRTALGSPTEQPFPYALVDQLFPELGLLTAELPPVAAPVPPHLLRRVYQAALDLTAQLPLLLCVDDLHHADHASQQCLLYLIRRLRTARAALVVTEAPHGAPAHRTLLSELQYQPRTRHLALTPLSPQGITRLLTHRLGEPAAIRLTPHVHRLTGGNPLLLRALLDDAAAATGPAGQVPTPGAAYRAAALACAHRSGTDALAAARATAILGTDGTDGPDAADGPHGTTDTPEPPDTTLLAATAALTPQAVRPALDALTASALYDDRRRPRHPAVDEALLADLSSAAHTALRARAARALHAQGASAAAVAA
ncbi:ATP-binding protein, partial [Streptomyces huiliensis]|uniref:ATP-binding protein n=1 Tax=Streptomyces huiliensis TaxID=2876027 RepID=UPI001CBC4689